MYRNLLLFFLIVVILVFFSQEIIKKQFGLSWPINGAVTSPFGTRIHPIKKTQLFHNGIDISAPSGTPVFSPGTGIVTNEYYNEAGGNQLVVRHNNGYTTGYAHLSKSLVDIGDRVKKNQKIGLTGATGKVTGPHLHFTVRDTSGNYVNPQKILS